MSTAESPSPTKSSDDPPETDLDYYSRPENYTGSSLQTMQKFVFAQEKETKNKEDKKDKQFSHSEILINRYRRTMPMDDDEENMLRREFEEVRRMSVSQWRTARVRVSIKPQLIEIEEKYSDSDIILPATTICHSVEEAPPVVQLAAPMVVEIGPSTTEVEAPKIDHPIIIEEPDEEREETGVVIDEPGVVIEEPGFVIDESQANDSDFMDDGMQLDDAECLSPTRKKSTLMSGRQSALLRHKHSQMEMERRKQIARDRWMNTFKVIRLIKRLSDAIIKKTVKKTGGMQTFTDIANDTETSGLESCGLSFDPNYFKANREITISQEAKSILSTYSHMRTADQVQTAMFGLQHLKSFAEYPLHMQEKLCKVAWYEVVPPRRVIIRQGHYAENFYFILSGQAVVTIMLQKPNGESFVKTATVMRKGMSFGELALLHRSRRTATVTSQDTVHLLSIGREDFFDIFMSGHGGIPDHVKFVSKLPVMQDWPIEQLLENPQYCLLHFFKRNVVIVKDSRVSDWLYVVKSGSCQVIKQLKGVRPKLGVRRSSEIDKQFNFPKLKTAAQEAKIDTGLRKKKCRYSCRNSAGSAMKQSPTPTDPPVFVQVELLKRRDVFGLERVQFDDDIERPSTVVSLVSKGAECIMISKEIFSKHANEKVKKRFRQLLRVYPAEDTFQENLQIKADWELYKDELIVDLTR